MAKEYRLQSVERALNLLETIVKAKLPVRAKDVADRHGLQLPTAYHLLNTLVAMGYVRKEDRSYLPGQKIPELYRVFEDAQLPGPRPMSTMFQVAEITGDTTYLSRWQYDDVTIVAVADGSRSVRVADVRIGLRGHAHARASGKVLFAWGPPERLANYLRRPLEQLTPHTLTDHDDLAKEVSLVRSAGYAIDREEYLEGVCCIAAPVLEGSYATIALTVTLPAERLQREGDNIIQTILEVTQRASHAGPVYGSPTSGDHAA